MPVSEALNLEYIDQQYQAWRRDPHAVSDQWRFFFEGFDLAAGRAGREAAPEDMRRQARVEALVNGYRELGHLLSCLDPLAECPADHPLLAVDQFGLTNDDLGAAFLHPMAGREGKAALKDIIRDLREVYCGSIGAEYMHLPDPEERRFIRERLEPPDAGPDWDEKSRKAVLRGLVMANTFESYLNKKYMAQTRFSLEGGESLIPGLNDLVGRAAGFGVKEVILGMAHRGRLNVQVNVLGKPTAEIFREFINTYDPDCTLGAGDVKYHTGYLADVDVGDDQLSIFLVNNPSHLESVDPVAEGVARGRRDLYSEADAVLPLLIHGDAAFAAQGVVFETLNLSRLDGYETGGTVHIVLNNQIGYTTLPEDARSSRYATDAAKILPAPVFHVHGEDPEAVVRCLRLALDYRRAFGKDIVVDLVCYRRYGHNEGDEPYFTQPLMYERIRDRPPVHDIYAERLIRDRAVDREAVDGWADELTREMDQAFEQAKENPGECFLPHFFDNWQGFHGQYDPEPIQTGVAEDRLQDIGRRVNTLPEGFTPFKKLNKLFERRAQAIEEGQGLDWANAEALAFGSLAADGRFVRLSGQDVGRGTFSQRHCVVHDTQDGREYVPLNHLAKDQAPFIVYNSPLSEEAVIGFEYGYALARPEGLVLWEAQFGDFANNAQSIIDLYLASGQSKWGRLNGLTLLLPHGWEGLGPEHSSARLERFLQLCAEQNMLACYPSTPAQYFHLLRRQALAAWRKPLVVMTPKSLLRNPLAVSSLADLATGRFETVIDDDSDLAGPPDRVLLTSGKMYYELLQRRRDISADGVAIVRIEQYYPFPEAAVARLAEKYGGAKQWFWVQEGPENMEAWRFLRPRLAEVLGVDPGYIGRQASPSPATGYANIYRAQQAAIVDQAVGPREG
jgi:2-oxoglutarate dehydrogenase E1 component